MLTIFRLLLVSVVLIVLQVTLFPFSLHKLFVLLCLMWLSLPMGLILSVLSGILFGLIAGELLGRDAVIYLSWWLVLFFLRRHYVYFHPLLFVVVVLGAYLSLVAFDFIQFNGFEILFWIFVSLIARWIHFRASRRNELILKY